MENGKQFIVCAACQYEYIVLCSARHWDILMKIQLRNLNKLGAELKMSFFEEGFIDQFGDFIERKEAYIIAKKSGQLNLERNVSHIRLFSEGLY